MVKIQQDRNLICETAVLMECYLEHLDAAHFVLGAFAILEACTNVMVIHQHGASVHTLPLNLNVLKGREKSQKNQAMITFVRMNGRAKLREQVDVFIIKSRKEDGSTYR